MEVLLPHIVQQVVRVEETLQKVSSSTHWIQVIRYSNQVLRYKYSDTQIRYSDTSSQILRSGTQIQVLRYEYSNYLQQVLPTWQD